jgi:hypothetical protein
VGTAYQNAKRDSSVQEDFRRAFRLFVQASLDGGEGRKCGRQIHAGSSQDEGRSLDDHGIQLERSITGGSHVGIQIAERTGSYKRAQACLIVDSEETMQEEEEGKEAAAL